MKLIRLPFVRSIDELPQEELISWRRWQHHRSPHSCVGLEAFGRCLAQVLRPGEFFSTNGELLVVWGPVVRDSNRGLDSWDRNHQLIIG